MENSLSRTLIEAIVKNSIKNIKDCPEQGIRNLIDMALQFSAGRFQKSFFSTAQAMLQNEHSAYYSLVKRTVSSVDTERLCTFGMNIGYNGYTVGAQRIRENEKKLHCNIPWALILQLDENHWAANEQRYQHVLHEGEALGIYMWMLFVNHHPEKMLDLPKNHTDSDFCIFCQAKNLTPAFLDEVADLYNVMLVVQYEENTVRIFDLLREKGLLFSVWYPYGSEDTKDIINGNLFNAIQPFTPLFTVLLPEENCPDVVQNIVYQVIKRVRADQIYSTLLWELPNDHLLIDAIISDDPCFVHVDQDGVIHRGKAKNGRTPAKCVSKQPHPNFDNALPERK